MAAMSDACPKCGGFEWSGPTFMVKYRGGPNSAREFRRECLEYRCARCRFIDERPCCDADDKAPSRNHALGAYK